MIKTVTSLLLYCSTLSWLYAQAPAYENLVFEGAGIRGIAYGGVIKVMEQNGSLKHIKRVGGTSAGAITALMLAIGYQSDEIYSIISGTRFQRFNDGNFFFIGGISRINNRYGWYEAEEFNKWLEEIIKTKTGNADITFSGLKTNGFKELYVTATCLNRQTLVVFSEATYPDMKIKDAVRASMSVPLYFEAVFMDSLGNVYKNKDERSNLDVMIDGGIVANFPVFLFDSIMMDTAGHRMRIVNKKTIGVRIDSDDQIRNDSLNRQLVPLQITNVSEYLQAFYVFVLENLNRTPLLPEDWERTISVSSVEINSRVKRLSTKEKEALVKSGEYHTRRFFERKP